MELTKRIDTILADIERRGYFPTIGRYSYNNLNVDEEMAIITAIGKSRTTDFIIDDHNRAAYENILKWCIGDKSAMAQDPVTKDFIPANMNAGWWIAGNTGSGKSWCLDIIRAYCAHMRFQIDFGNTEGRLVWQNHNSDTIAAEYQESGKVECRNYHIIGIHDVGTEQVETVYMGNRVPVIRDLLEFRGDNPDMITFVTSNDSIGGNNPKDKYGDRVVSRLHEMFNYIEIRGVDRRKKSSKH